MDDIEVVDADVAAPESDADAGREGGGMAIASSIPRPRSRSGSPGRMNLIVTYDTKLSDTGS